jgi:TolB-like protein/Tfp pilus assembly protein PilF
LKKISGPELAILTVLLFIAGSVLWAFSGTGEEQQTAQADSREAARQPSAAAPAAAAAPAPSAPRTAVAVLPFANLTGDASKEYLGDGMAEELINTLTKVQGLRVPARTSTFAYKGRNTDIRQIAKDLGVGTILEGSVRAAGKRLRITAQLINAQDGLHLWSETYDEEFTDIFMLQDKLANAIALALEPKLADAGASPVTPTLPTQDVEAYNLYLQGWSLVSRVSAENEKRAIEYFNRAIARDPNFARAYAGIASAYLAGADFLPDASAAADRAARKALALDPNLAYGHMTMAGVAVGLGQPLEMEAHDLAALSLAPNDGYVHLTRAIHLARTGRLKEAFETGQRAYALAPANPYVVAVFAGINAGSGRDSEASQYAAAAIDLGMSKDSSPLLWVDAAIAQHAGRYAEAAAAYSKIYSDTRIVESGRLAVTARENPAQRAAALSTIARLFSAAPYSSACLVGAQYMFVVGGLDEAYELANRCLSRMEPAAIAFVSTQLPVWGPDMQAFRRDARFSALVTRVGLMEYYRQYGPPIDCEINNNRLTCH